MEEPRGRVHGGSSLLGPDVLAQKQRVCSPAMGKEAQRVSTDAAHSGWGRQAGPGPFWDGRGPGKAANASGGTNSHEHMPRGGLEAASALGRQGTWQRSQEYLGQT